MPPIRIHNSAFYRLNKDRTDKTAEENNTLCIGEKQKEARFEVGARFETSEEARTDCELEWERNRIRTGASAAD